MDEAALKPHIPKVLENESLQQAINETVRISSYDPEWPQKFEDEKRRLLAFSPGSLLAIEHIGSTAVPFLSAKPVIDLMGGVRVISEADALLPMLCKNGYTTSAEFNATLVNSRWLMRHAEGHRTHHLHLMVFQSDEWRGRLKFRDALRADSALARRYKELKVSLAEAVGSKREDYTAAKSDFVEEVLKRAD